MPSKRALKAPPAPGHSPAKKAPRPANLKKKKALPKPAAEKKELQPANQKPEPLPVEITQQLTFLLKDQLVSARSIGDFVVGPTCGLESRHANEFPLVNSTPFLMAVNADRLDVVQLLVVEHSVNTKAVAAGNYTALHFASWNGNVEMVRYLVEQCGLDVLAVQLYSHLSLHIAIICKHNDVALLLLELGSDPNRMDMRKSTPLHYACSYRLLDVARALVAKGANTEAGDQDGLTPLHWASEEGDIDVVLLLLELGADPNLLNGYESTPLHLACLGGLVDVAKVLIAEGALRDVVNREGMTPLDAAVESGYSEVVALLENRR